MMQNSPLLVAKINPANNIKDTSAKAKQPSEGAAPFKQVMSKQVEQSDAKKVESKAKETESKTNEIDSKAKEANKSDTKNTKVNVRDNKSDEASVDAQALAATVTAKTIQEATDGEVVLDKPKEEDLSLKQDPDAKEIKTVNDVIGDAQTKVVNLIPTPQTAKPSAVSSSDKAGGQGKITTASNLEETIEVDQATQENLQKGIATEANDRDKKAQQASSANQPLALAGQDDVADTKGKLKADVALDKTVSEGRQFAQALATEKNAQVFKEAASVQTTTNMIEPNAISAMTMHTAVKSTASTGAIVEPPGLSNMINVAPGKPGWDAAIGQKIAWMVGASEQSATLTLNPKDLGPLQVIIQVNNDKADATFISENPEVRKALEDGMSGLRQSMGQAGVELGQANVNTGKEHQAFQQANKGYSSHQANAGNEGQVQENINNQAPRVIHAGNGLVDTFA